MLVSILVFVINRGHDVNLAASTLQICVNFVCVYTALTLKLVVVQINSCKIGFSFVFFQINVFDFFYVLVLGLLVFLVLFSVLIFRPSSYFLRCPTLL